MMKRSKSLTALLDKVVNIPVIQITLLVILFILVSMFSLSAQTPRRDSGADGLLAVSGTIVSEVDGKPIQGVSIQVQGEKGRASSKSDGSFSLPVSNPKGTVSLSHMGFKRLELTYFAGVSLQVKLIPIENQLDEVEVVSTGYQKIPKERATGSFVQVDNKLLNRQLSANILDRLNGVSSAVLFDKSAVSNTNQAGIAIRGRSTLFSNDEPLIILDNFPYSGDINAINPNDIESISILKDAGAASIWGARAGNGVIVITTKKGSKSSVPQLNVVANVDFTAKPDLYYPAQMTSSEFITLERFLYEKGRYNSIINNGYGEISPVVALLEQQRKGEISQVTLEQNLLDLSKTDTRNDLEHWYRVGLRQQYALNLRGGSDRYTYFGSYGYDRDQQTLTTDNNRRHSFNFNSSLKLVDHVLNLTSFIQFSDQLNKSNNQSFTPNYPYLDLIGINSEALVVSDGTLNMAYAANPGSNQLLDWSYRPWEENNANYSAETQSIRIGAGLEVKPLDWLTGKAEYMLQRNNGQNEILYWKDSYYVRNMVNTYSHLDPAKNTLIRPIPGGDILDQNNISSISKSFRASVTVDKRVGKKNSINGILGWEIRDDNASRYRNYFYGFNKETRVNQNAAIDYVSTFPFWFGNGSGRIPNNDNSTASVDRFLSYFFNGSYSYDNKYILSISARKDESNLFGVKSNQRGVPLWSVGGRWNAISQNGHERKLLSRLALRSSFGYSGNVDRSLSAYLTAQPSVGLTPWNANNLTVVNPPNPSLRWEKVKNWNIGLDLSLYNDVLELTADYFIKDGLDLMGTSLLAPQTGVTQFRGNTASTRTQGLDLILKSTLKFNKVKWLMSLQPSFMHSKVLKNYVGNRTNVSIASNNRENPQEGYPYYALFSFQWAGLDAMGNPQGMKDGQSSVDYASLLNANDLGQLIYHGSLSPTSYGNFMHTINYGNLSLSFNLVYKLGYYFRRNNVFNGSNVNYRQEGFSDRWQEQGDENVTFIPSLSYPLNNNRGTFFNLSEKLVEPADHIRLKDIRIGYSFRQLPAGIKGLELFGTVTNVGLLWKRTKVRQDPDFNNSIPAPKTFLLGANLKIN
ncbi:SusC/RagA family TonB-linked outer membrane protein [Sphingobacterium sp.]|uniref:SusC/RagA family TonB-linked outer membrane protein n=1 Tax=Sphingobacterium sp. TaxID=341027 RepID=UPI002590A306|nr:SusC/RagA family TonB-linked outer membrane protein [Sphingobacterium sp.]WET68776.1 MAG: SusC/RagA family TonB-linked outer membrane protein [Sphingobacterium sp.]